MDWWDALTLGQQRSMMRRFVLQPPVVSTAVVTPTPPVVVQARSSKVKKLDIENFKGMPGEFIEAWLSTSDKPFSIRKSLEVIRGRPPSCRGTLMLQQDDHLRGPVQRFGSMSGMIGPLTQEKLAALEPTTHEITGKFAKCHTATFAHIQQLDLWVYDNVQNSDAGQMDVVVKALGRAYALAANSVQELVDADKTPPSPPVTPLELVSSELPVVAQMINSRRGQLTHKFDEAMLHNIVAEFSELRHEYDLSNKFRQAIKESDKPLAMFDAMWAVGDAASKFPTLAEFCRGFASYLTSRRRRKYGRSENAWQNQKTLSQRSEQPGERLDSFVNSLTNIGFGKRVAMESYLEAFYDGLNKPKRLRTRAHLQPATLSEALGFTENVYGDRSEPSDQLVPVGFGVRRQQRQGRAPRYDGSGKEVSGLAGPVSGREGGLPLAALQAVAVAAGIGQAMAARTTRAEASKQWTANTLEVKAEARTVEQSAQQRNQQYGSGYGGGGHERGGYNNRGRGGYGASSRSGSVRGGYGDMGNYGPTDSRPLSRRNAVDLKPLPPVRPSVERVPSTHQRLTSGVTAGSAAGAAGVAPASSTTATAEIGSQRERSRPECHANIGKRARAVEAGAQLLSKDRTGGFAKGKTSGEEPARRFAKGKIGVEEPARGAIKGKCGGVDPVGRKYFGQAAS
ncbi:unnamed protein product [Phytophthora fragariaefolia]|uniref:Unnamed protein product n=1 Tax=Phytophthora fragariaefolia TaxID=1490495 RepID=A0A9W7D3G2_9STRA|nr:unnamed protein product [Phytophthora fragariaefolia]